MNAAELCAALRQGLPALFECAPAPRDAVRVRTPMMYPDGGIVDVFVLGRGDSFTLTDFGETLGWLRMQTVSPKRTPNQRRLIEDVCDTLGLELHRGQLVLRGVAVSELCETVTRLAQGAVRVSDIWFTMRSRSFVSAVEEVGEWLTERDIAFEQSVQQEGRSGNTWTVDYRTYTDARTSLIFLLSTASRSVARRVSEHVVSGWVDLSHLKNVEPKTAFVSLFDDTSDVWREEDFRMVEDLSEVARWSHPEELEEILRAA